MAPTFPPSFRASGRRAAAAISISSSSSSGQHFAAAITISSSSSSSAWDAADAITISSSSSSSGRHAADAITISSSSSSFGNHGADVITISSSGPGPVPPTVVVVLPSSSAAVPALPVSSPSDGGGDEATSRRKRKARYRCWELDDELKVLRTMAKLREKNLGVLPQASWLFEALDGGRALCRRGVHVNELSQKVYHLKKKFRKAAANAGANGCRRRPKYRNTKLYEISKEVWPELLEAAAAAAP
ncbi:hypothetical protein ACP70R_009102 [Stipagrostis hirtigluma subsp. patula]